jgi:hypothetical protein
MHTNDDICLSLLGKYWRPTMAAQSIAHSIVSILHSATSKSLPMDSPRHASNQPGQIKRIRSIMMIIVYKNGNFIKALWTYRFFSTFDCSYFICFETVLKFFLMSYFGVDHSG